MYAFFYFAIDFLNELAYNELIFIGDISFFANHCVI